MIKQQPLVSIAELLSAGVEVTICKPGKAKGIPRRSMRCKSPGNYIVGGNKPAKLVAGGTL